MLTFLIKKKNRKLDVKCCIWNLMDVISEFNSIVVKSRINPVYILQSVGK